MQMIELVTRLSTAAMAEEGLEQVTAELKSLSSETARLLELLEFISGKGTDAEQAFFRSPQVSIFKIRFDPGRQTPPHDHGAWAAILLLQGSERNTLYQAKDEDGLVQIGQITLEPGSVLPMAAEAIHVAECLSAMPAVGLHVYGGDEVVLKRRVWNPQTLQPHPHSESLYTEWG